MHRRQGGCRGRGHNTPATGQGAKGGCTRGRVGKGTGAAAVEKVSGFWRMMARDGCMQRAAPRQTRWAASASRRQAGARRASRRAVKQQSRMGGRGGGAQRGVQGGPGNGPLGDAGSERLAGGRTDQSVMRCWLGLRGGGQPAGPLSRMVIKIGRGRRWGQKKASAAATCSADTQATDRMRPAPGAPACPARGPQ